ncbi:hypothetical protein QBC33DRAFT_540973 [Phialemonium atrogriseum]|uniref:Uncharacterized protein n=1 Tax=Phialemonium atrogriseum TaxID=1093897 RepID=A0AAJ0C0E7_9PEZI|nr:uncharacterized protein QBC33DRAFT_540973 [Phialemonium atrogriseum]KAK1766417.1 hypothetical protein QBC33DRAFT_540973 [Phialemonium atrogriseum]
MDTASAPADSGEEIQQAGAIQVALSEYYEQGAFMELYFGPDGSPHACIDAWEQAWADQHWGCHDADVIDLYPRRLGPRPGDETRDPPIYLLECCGQKRPWACDTYLQYVSAVHPWLMAMRDTLLDVLGKMDATPKWPPETKLAVLYLGPGPLRIGHEDKWAFWHKRLPMVYPAIDQASAEERHRRAMERMMARSAAVIRAREEEAARVAEMEKEK